MEERLPVFLREQADGGDASRSSLNALAGIVCGDPAQGHDGDILRRVDGFRQGCETDTGNHAVGRDFLKDRCKEQEVCEFAAVPDFLNVVAGRAYNTGAPVLAEQASGGQGVIAGCSTGQVNTVASSFQRKRSRSIEENLHMAAFRPDGFDDRDGERFESSRKQVFFANLQVVHAAVSQSACLGLQSLCARMFVSRKEGALGDGIEKHLKAN